MPIYKVRDTAQSYGHALGILLVKCSTPFVPGDVGNATSFNYPVLYHEMPDVSLERLIEQGDDSLLDGVIAAGRYLEGQGVKGITSDCGFMIRFQPQLAEALNVPVFLSPLMQVPIALAAFSSRRPVGILTANAKRLSADLLRNAGIPADAPTPVYGLEEGPAFRDPILKETGTLDQDAVAAEVTARARAMVADHPDMAAIVLECSNLPPYAADIQKATGLPVLDFITLADHFIGASRRRPFVGDY